MRSSDWTLYVMIMFIALALALDSVYDWGLVDKLSKPLSLETVRKN